MSSEEVNPDLMKAFYHRLYPFHAIYIWLNHQDIPTRQFTHREFAFTLQGDVYLRYNSFNNAEELKKQVIAYNPTRFEIGPVYNQRPRDRKTARQGTFAPLLRELVFDIDMTDYDSVRTCCSKADICSRCWGFIASAVRVLDAAIRDQFGFNRLLWVYSGRRGIHLWVSDREALELTDEQRKAIVGWLGVIHGGKEQGKKVNVRLGSKGLPPSIKSALDVLSSDFTDLILNDQDCFYEEEKWEELLRLLPDREIVRRLEDKWSRDKNRSSELKWSDIKAETKNLEKGSSQRVTMTAALEDIVLQYTYPRLDAEVSKHRNHLLKAPFCIHPKTGRVCVPVDPQRVDEFDPSKVPTVNQLLRELDREASRGDAMQTDAPAEASAEKKDWEKTSLKPYVQMLEQIGLQLKRDFMLAKSGGL